MENGNKSGKCAPEQSTCGPNPATQNFLDKVLTNSEYNEEMKKRLENETGMQLVKFEELVGFAPEFAGWLKKIVRYQNVDSNILIFTKTTLHPETLKIKEERFRCWIYTGDNKYSIAGKLPSNLDSKGYLGCVVSKRKPRVGEDWCRGNDLADGNYSKETFISIVNDIVAYEIKTLQVWR